MKTSKSFQEVMRGFAMHYLQMMFYYISLRKEGRIKGMYGTPYDDELTKAIKEYRNLYNDARKCY